MSRRKYTEAEKAAALAFLDSNGGNVARTSRETGIPRKTIAEWRDGRGVNGTVAELRHENARSLGELFEEVARKYLEHALSAPAVQGTSSKDAVTAAAIAFDKLQLSQGKPTEINRHEHSERATPDRAIDAAATALRRSGIVN